MDRTYQASFNRIQAGANPGLPRFKGRGRYTSFTYPQVGDHGGARFDNGLLVRSKLGRIAVRWSRPGGPWEGTPKTGTPKTGTISRETDGWSACISCADVPVQPVQPVPPTGQETGIDLGLESFATLADGTMIHNPRCSRKAEAYPRCCQRRVARRKKGSSRRKQAVKLLAKAHLKVKRQHTDLHHTGALALVQSYDTIYYEDLQTATMLKQHSLAKSISDAAWRAVLTILVFKPAYAGKQVVAVPPAYTCLTCSGCGILVRKGLSGRWHSCPECGTSLHRDHNAARNILALGKKGSAAGQAVQALTQADAPYVA